MYLTSCLSNLLLLIKLSQNLVAENSKHFLSLFLWVRNWGAINWVVLAQALSWCDDEDVGQEGCSHLKACLGQEDHFHDAQSHMDDEFMLAVGRGLSSSTDGPLHRLPVYPHDTAAGFPQNEWLKRKTTATCLLWPSSEVKHSHLKKRNFFFLIVEKYT